MNHYEEFIKIMEKYPSFQPDTYIKDFLDKLIAGELIDSVNVERIKNDMNFSYFFAVRTIIGFVTPTMDLAREIKKVVGTGKVLEIGAGTGLLAKYLNASGVDIKATDDFSWYNSDERNWKLYYNIEEIDYKDAIKKYSADYLLLCWSYMDSLAWEASKLFTELNPEGKILYIGEWEGGCTADDTFFEGTEVIDELESVNRQYPQWFGLHDYVYLMKWVGIYLD